MFSKRKEICIYLSVLGKKYKMKYLSHIDGKNSFHRYFWALWCLFFFSGGRGVCETIHRFLYLWIRLDKFLLDMGEY